MISFNFCAIALLAILIISSFFRKMTQGTDGKVFLCLMLTAFITACVDTSTISLDNLATAFPDEISDFFNGFRFAFHVIYLTLRNLIIPLFIVYMIALADRWHKLRSVGLGMAVLLLPCLFSVTLILTNGLTLAVFYFDEEQHYTRGQFFPILYICAALYMIGGLLYLFHIRKLMHKYQFFGLLSLFPLNIASVVVQMLSPGTQVEMFATAVALMLMTIYVQRPEDIIDSLTGLRHRNSYADDMNKNFDNEKHVEIVMINIANLDTILNMLDYDCANELLHNIASQLEGTVNEFKLNAKCYYLNRGKFRIVNHCSREHTHAAAEKINSYLRQSMVIGRMEFNLIAHICILNCPEDISDFKSLIAFGNDFHEKMPYTGNVITAAEIVMKNSFRLSRDIDRIIDKAFANHNFKVYYQPIYSVEKQRFTSAEALLRLIDDEYGFVPPDTFIPAAEKSGAIHKIGDLVVEEVCRFIASPEFKKLGLEYIEINLSVAQCMQTDLADKILNILKSYEIDPSTINLEITETAANYAQNIMTSNIDKLVDAGVSFSLDDYGTGYSNIKSVASLPITLVKLDKTFADEMCNEKMHTVLVDTIRMMKNLHMHLVVEGIETREMLEHFTELKCDYIQGYYFSKPIPEVDFRAFIAEKNHVYS